MQAKDVAPGSWVEYSDGRQEVRAWLLGSPMGSYKDHYLLGWKVGESRVGSKGYNYGWEERAAIFEYQTLLTQYGCEWGWTITPSDWVIAITKQILSTSS